MTSGPESNCTRRLARGALTLAGAVLLALLGAASAVAQTTITLVSNHGETFETSRGLHVDHAQAFTTGSDDAGYTLTGIDIRIAGVRNATDVNTVTLRTASGGLPGTSLGTLTAPSSFTANALSPYTTAGIDLAPNTTYFVVIGRYPGAHTGTTNALWVTASTNEASGSQSGWTIDDPRLIRPTGSSDWQSDFHSILMVVKGYAKDGTDSPVFSGAMITRSVAENTAAGQNVGAPVAATDPNNDTLRYTLGGPDAGSFDIVSTTGQIRTKSGVTYDHESRDSYSVTVTASDGVGRAVATVTISVTDVDEPPSAPAAPTVSGTPNSITSIDVAWSAPANAGSPVTDYDLQYRQGSSGEWTDGPQDVSATSATIGSLMANTAYQVQVRASSEEGTSGWSQPGSGRTREIANRAPEFDSATVTLSMAELTPAGQDVGTPVTATDPDDDELSYSLGGTDADSFDIDSESGQIRTVEGAVYDYETKTSYSLTVTASDPFGASASASLTVNLTDVTLEPPPAPFRPGVVPTPGTIDSLSVYWGAPDNAGRPPVTGYDIRYGEQPLLFFESTEWQDGPQGVSATTATVSGLDSAESYDVAVRAVNADGPGAWSEGNSARTFRQSIKVAEDDTYVPPELAFGDRYRLLFLGSNTNFPASSSLSGDYTSRVRELLTLRLESITGSIWTVFRALVSTRHADARLYTGTTYTADDKGVPIYWVNGGKVADDYEDFYDGDWDDETGARNELGELQTVEEGVWTGSGHDGTELFEGSVSRALGESQAGYGAPGSAAPDAGPLYSGMVADSTEERRLYGITEVLQFIAPLLAGNDLSAEPPASGDSDTSAGRSQAFTTGGNPHGYDFGGIAVGYEDSERDPFTVALYTANEQGHPQTLVASLEAPDYFHPELVTTETYFSPPSEIVLDPDTTYVAVLRPATDGTDVELRASASDDEDSESLPGWSIADTFAIESGGNWQADADGRALVIEVRGLVKTGPPGKPTGLAASAVGRYRLDLSWTAPEFDGNLDITGYRIEVSSDGGTNWTDVVADTGSVLTAYQHQPLPSGSMRRYRVSAINSAGAGEPSDPADGTTNPNQIPAFPVPSATVSVGENTPAGTNIPGAGRTATDPDGDTLAYSFLTTGGSDYQHFAINESTGQVRTHGPLDYETRSSYSVTVRAADTEGAVGAIAYTIEVADVDEPPDAPATPAVSAVPIADVLNPQYRLRVSWSAPANAGRPPISGYDVQYRQGTAGGWSNGPQGVSATETILDGLAEDTAYQVQVRASNDEGDSPWSSPPGSGRTNSRDNSAPVFAQPSVVLTVAENTPATRAIGSPVAATDSESDDVAYSLEGTDASSFSVDPSTGQVRTQAPLDFETRSSYAFLVRAEDDRDASSTAAVTVEVTNLIELPAAPAPPTVTAAFRSDTSLDVAWTEPANPGPPITSYDLQYREGSSGGWTNGPQNVTVTMASVSGLVTGTAYQVQVRASNADGDGPWSQPGTGSTNTVGNRPPAFARSSATFDIPENSPGGLVVGTPLTATDPDEDETLEYTLVGADAASFDIEAGTGQILTRSGADYDYEARNRYELAVKADDGFGGSDTVDVTIRLTDVREPPPAPGPPDLEPVFGSATSLAATWQRPATPDRPPATSYDLQYRLSGDTTWRNGPQNRPAAIAEITGLEAGATYEVQVRATSAEGDSEWSQPGFGTTHTLAVRVSQAPARHDGSAPFTVQFQFSEEIAITDEDEFRDDAASASGGSLTAARRVSGSVWEVTLQPDSNAALVVSLRSGGNCAGTGALCTAGGAPLSHDLDHAVPGPDTPILSLRALASAVDEGSPALFELRRDGAPLDDPLTVSLEVQTDGDLFSGSPPTTATFPPGVATAVLTVATVDDTAAEPGGYILYRLEPDPGSSPLYVPGTANEAAVQVRDNDGGQPPPLSPLKGAQRAASGTSSSSVRKPQPLQLALWTDRLGYVAGQSVRLYRTLQPHDDSGRYRTFVYLEKAGGGERRYLAPIDGEGTLRAEAVDHRGIPAWASTARTLFPTDKALVWEGPAPEVGLWRFVMDLRPEGAAGPEDEIDGRLEASRGIRRAWANFAVARRGQLLNRRGFDREVRSDMTLTPDYLYFIGHQLFVRDGATLTIEPGTVLRAWGRHSAIIVEQGGKIVAEGTRAAPVVLTCSLPLGEREPGCWAGLRILGRAPVTRLEGVADGVLPADRPVYGGSDPRDSSGSLRYVRVEFAGAAAQPGSAAPAIGLYGVGDGTVIEHVQSHASGGPGIAFSGGTAACDQCVASGSGAAGLAWERGWRGSASHLYVQHGDGGTDGIDGAGDEQGWDLEPRSLPSLANVTLVHSHPYGRRERRGAALRLSAGSGVRARDLLATNFGGGAIDARARSALLFRDGESSVTTALLFVNGVRPLRGVYDTVEFINRDPRLRDVRWFANPDPRPRLASPALRPAEAETGEEGPAEPHYIGAFGEDTNWLEEWTFFGSESDYDTTGENDGDN